VCVRGGRQVRCERQPIDLRPHDEKVSGVSQYSDGNKIVVAARLPASSVASVMTHSFTLVNQAYF
jgi:hypothetical protein